MLFKFKCPFFRSDLPTSHWSQNNTLFKIIFSAEKFFNFLKAVTHIISLKITVYFSFKEINQYFKNSDNAFVLTLVDKSGGSLSYKTIDNELSEVRWVSGGVLSNGYLRSVRAFKNVSDFMKKTCVKEGDRMEICTTLHCDLKLWSDWELFPKPVNYQILTTQFGSRHWFKKLL